MNVEVLQHFTVFSHHKLDTFSRHIHQISKSAFLVFWKKKLSPPLKIGGFSEDELWKINPNLRSRQTFRFFVDFPGYINSDEVVMLYYQGNNFHSIFQGWWFNSCQIWFLNLICKIKFLSTLRSAKIDQGIGWQNQKADMKL